MKIFWMTADQHQVADVGTDSSLILRDNPWFKPDEREWQATWWLGVRVCRLGMKIAEKFASRYYDAVTIIMHPSHVEGDTESEFSRDGAAMCGKFVSLTLDNVTVSADGEHRLTLAADWLRNTVDHALGVASDLHTVKTGDIIAIPLNIAPVVPLTLHIDVDINIDNQHCLLFKTR